MAEDVAIAFATINRPYVVQRLIRSIRRHYPQIPIYVADQSRHIPRDMCDFYAGNGVTLLRMPYDCGVTVARNALVAAMQEEFFLLCDDDFIFNEHTDFALPTAFLRGYQDFGVVGGHLRDLHDGKFSSRHWELNLYLDPQKNLLTALPISIFAPSFVAYRGHRFFVCDAVMNFALFRRSMFAEGAGWDPRFKSNGEHEDFFLNLKQNTRFRVAYFPGLTADHHHPSNHGYSRLRLRNLGWKLFFDKWGITQYLDYEWGLRTLRQVDVVHPIADVRNQFFLSSRGRVDRTGAWGQDKIHVEDDGTIYGNGLVDRSSFGSTSGQADEPLTWVTVQASTSQVVVARAPGQVATRGPAKAAETSPSPPRIFDVNSDVLTVRYADCLFEEDDFVVFLSVVRFAPLSMNAAICPATLKLNVRWARCGGVVPTWECAPHDVEIGTDGAAAVLLPRLMPAERMEHLLFDISSSPEAGEMPVRLATGAVRSYGGRRSKGHSSIESRDVSALSFAPLGVRRKLDNPAFIATRSPNAGPAPGFATSTTILGKDRLVRGVYSGAGRQEALVLSVRGAGGTRWADAVDLGIVTPPSNGNASPDTEVWFGAGAFSVLGTSDIQVSACP